MIGRWFLDNRVILCGVPGNTKYCRFLFQLPSLHCLEVLAAPLPGSPRAAHWGWELWAESSVIRFLMALTELGPGLWVWGTAGHYCHLRNGRWAFVLWISDWSMFLQFNYFNLGNNRIVVVKENVLPLEHHFLFFSSKPHLGCFFWFGFEAKHFSNFPNFPSGSMVSSKWTRGLFPTSESAHGIVLRTISIRDIINNSINSLCDLSAHPNFSHFNSFCQKGFHLQL